MLILLEISMITLALDFILLFKSRSTALLFWAFFAANSAPDVLSDKFWWSKVFHFWLINITFKKSDWSYLSFFTRYNRSLAKSRIVWQSLQKVFVVTYFLHIFFIVLNLSFPYSSGMCFSDLVYFIHNVLFESSSSSNKTHLK